MAIRPGVACVMSAANAPVLEEMEDFALTDDGIARACLNMDARALRSLLNDHESRAVVTPAHLRLAVMKKQTKSDAVVRFLVRILGPAAASEALDVAFGERKTRLLLSLGADPGRFTFLCDPAFRRDFNRLGNVNGSGCPANFSHPENMFCAIVTRVLAGAVPPAHVRRWINRMASSNTSTADGRSCSVPFLIEKFLGGPSTPSDDAKDHVAMCHGVFERRGLVLAARRRFPEKNGRQLRFFVNAVTAMVREHRWRGGPAHYKYWKRFPRVFSRFATFLIRYSSYAKTLPVRIYVQRALAFDEQLLVSRHALEVGGLGTDGVDAFCRSVRGMRDVWLHEKRLPRRELENNVRGEEDRARNGESLAKRADYFGRAGLGGIGLGGIGLGGIVRRLVELPPDLCRIVVSYL